MKRGVALPEERKYFGGTQRRERPMPAALHVHGRVTDAVFRKISHKSHSLILPSLE